MCGRQSVSNSRLPPENGRMFWSRPACRHCPQTRIWEASHLLSAVTGATWCWHQCAKGVAACVASMPPTHRASQRSAGPARAHRAVPCAGSHSPRRGLDRACALCLGPDGHLPPPRPALCPLPWPPPPAVTSLGDNALCMGAAGWEGLGPEHWPLGHWTSDPGPQLTLDEMRIPRVESVARLGTAEDGAWAGSHTLCTALQPCP